MPRRPLADTPPAVFEREPACPVHLRARPPHSVRGLAASARAQEPARPRERRLRRVAPAPREVDLPEELLGHAAVGARGLAVEERAERVGTEEVRRGEPPEVREARRGRGQRAESGGAAHEEAVVHGAEGGCVAHAHALAEPLLWPGGACEQGMFIHVCERDGAPRAF
ncbi:uncharacterized protein PHACADRAFT_162344 [Phanerochaete carnosa HHB-10118-sp]|uniref:Uncharacterized protein n=1 Tax=Phanerochaete carnosa (strain HHB-10118-sp) TaxID=650164 RepID=K5W492_PHACS|nr:uncharacterized protein PHACADRAFT_162344 [Phanerochaete carnosa HHB-10118-sp]EKM53965.1 hypothetical protein PHACADRAFT_162344 [Phanerochaete carnosa HHB-10118-sp]